MDPSSDAGSPEARAAWRRAAALELAAPGAAPDESAVDTLVTRSAEGAAIAPIYGDRTAPAVGAPGAFPFVRGARAGGEAWAIAARHDDADPTRVARAIAEDVRLGVEAVVIAVDRAGRLGLDPASELCREAVGDGGSALVVPSDVASLVAAADPARTILWIDAGANATPYVAAALAALEETDAGPSGARLYGGLDVAGALARDGALPRAVSVLATEAAELVGAWRTRRLGGRPLAVGASIVHEAGGHAAHELGFALAALAELLRALDGRGVAPADAAAAVAVEIAVGADLFAGMAKVRALRLAWSRMLVASGVSPAEVPPPFVAARTSARALSRLDPWTNAVRGTIEAFAAAAAGVDLLVVRPWDEPLGAPERAARRLARNTQLVLRDEARLADVADPAGGSGYVEAMTEALARAAWAELGRIEAEGGLLAALESGALAGRVREARTARARDLARRKVVRVGVNDFANPSERSPRRPPLRDDAAITAAAQRAIAARRPPPTVPDGGRLEAAAAIVGRGGAMALASQVLAVFGPEAPPSCEPLVPFPDAARFEALRARAAELVERTGAPLRALLVPLGTPASARARVAFSQRLLEVGGLEVETADPVATADAAAVAALASAVASAGASVVCLAGSDEAYDAIGLAVARSLSGAPGRPPVVLQAGRPPEAREAALREAGISAWFAAGGDAGEVLEEVLARLDVRAGEVAR